METQTGAIHRAKVWQLFGFSLNNIATNLYLWEMTFISYFLTGFVGVGVVVASSLVTSMRIWDGITDPFIGFIVDKTNGRFGKNRPFIVLGQIVMAITSAVMYFVTPTLPEAHRFIAFILIYAVYIVGYTLQCVVTKSAQTCLTNDPKQRPMLAVFTGIGSVVTFSVLPYLSYTYLLRKHNFQFDIPFFAEQWKICSLASAILSVIVIISLIEKDRTEYYGTGESIKTSFKDYWEIIKNNRAIQMLVVAASTDKLATQAKSDATITMIVYAIVCGNAAVSGMLNVYTLVPNIIFMIFIAGYIAAKMGQKRSIEVSSWGGIICCVGLILLFIFGDPKTLSLPGDGVFTGWSFFTVAFMILTVLYGSFNNVNTNVVITMTADCADYEVYRSGKYVPGMIGTLFSFIDKLVSSLSATLVGLMCAAIGFTQALPDANTEYSTGIFIVGMVGMYGLVLIGLIFNIIAMKHYPLTKEKMQEIQEEIAAIKAKNRNGAAAEQNVSHMEKAVVDSAV
ncbi:MAG: MFS transporter [Oribacterium sp.]|nr:MFS transporter [Oribacterium sp.]